MRGTAVAARWVARIAGVVALVLGLARWVDYSEGTLPLHMLSGLLVTVALLLACVVAAMAKLGAGRVVVGVLLALCLPALGMVQSTMLVGSLHWLVRVVHLALGLAALGFTEGLVVRILAHVDGAGVRDTRLA